MLPSYSFPVIIWCCVHWAKRIAGGQAFAVTEAATGWIIATSRFGNTNLFSLPKCGPPRGDFEHVVGSGNEGIGSGVTVRCDRKMNAFQALIYC